MTCTLCGTPATRRVLDPFTGYVECQCAACSRRQQQRLDQLFSCENCGEWWTFGKRTVAGRDYCLRCHTQGAHVAVQLTLPPERQIPRLNPVRRLLGRLSARRTVLAGGRGGMA